MISLTPIKHGKTTVLLWATVELAEVFGVSADYLLTGHPLTQTDEHAISALSTSNILGSHSRRRDGGFSREELQLLLEAMLQER